MTRRKTQSTGVAGGMLRDLLLEEIPLVFRREIYLYATAAFFGASLFVLLHFCSENGQFNMILGIAATLLLRLAGIRWRIGRPLFRLRHGNPLLRTNRFQTNHKSPNPL
jgi:uncharacterized membrane protein YeiH